MCGITGIISTQTVAQGIIEPMTDTIAHRGPDGEGFHYGSHFVFGHRRLAIVDLSESGKQPMVYQNRYVITFNGEIYNHIELRQELEQAGYAFANHTDTEVIMAAYDCWGIECLNRFNGMWAFVIYDQQTNVFFASRDRFGKKPFYYAQTDNSFIFASEIKAILAHPDMTAAPNMAFLQNYWRKSCQEYGTETAFQHIYRLPPAAYVTGCHADFIRPLQPVRFWHLKPNLSREPFNEEKAKQYADQYYQLLKDAVRIRLRADVPVGSALSGGLDSSSIVYLINQILQEEGKTELQQTFSSVYHSVGTEACDESVFINQMADLLKVQSNQIEPQVEDIPIEHKKMIWALENPPDNTLMSSWHTYKLVQQQGIKVTLDGQGADEQLAGYLYYLLQYFTDLPLCKIKSEYRSFRGIPGATRFARFGIAFNLARRVLGKRLLAALLNLKTHKKLVFSVNQQLASDINSSLITLIHYADHSSMAHSVESRMPFMDYRLVEFLASVPTAYKIHNGWTKYLARLAFDQKLPDEICWRKDKMGWPIPESQWFKQDLAAWLKHSLQDSTLLPKLGIPAQVLFNPQRHKLADAIKALNISAVEQQFLGKHHD